MCAKISGVRAKERGGKRKREREKKHLLRAMKRFSFSFLSLSREINNETSQYLAESRSVWVNDGLDRCADRCRTKRQLNGEKKRERDGSICCLTAKEYSPESGVGTLGRIRAKAARQFGDGRAVKITSIRRSDLPRRERERQRDERNTGKRSERDARATTPAAILIQAPFAGLFTPSGPDFRNTL